MEQNDGSDDWSHDQTREDLDDALAMLDAERLAHARVRAVLEALVAAVRVKVPLPVQGCLEHAFCRAVAAADAALAAGSGEAGE